MSKRTSILITHIWSDRNKGDSAIITATILTLKRTLPGASITLMSEFAPGDTRLSGETFQLKADFPDIEILGSLFPILPVQTPEKDTNPKAGPGIAAWYALRSLIILWLAPWLVDPERREYSSRTTHRDKKAWLIRCLGLTRDEIRTLDAICCADLLISKGGGFIFAQPSLRSTLRLCRVLFPLVVAQRLKRPVALLGQSIGPFATYTQRAITRYALRGMTLIGVRENVSEKTVTDLIGSQPNIGSQPKIKLIPDMALSLPCADKDAPELRTQASVIAKYPRPWIGLTVRRWGSAACPGDDEIYKRYLDALAGFCHHAIAYYKGTIFIWPQCTGPNPLENDLLASSDLVRLIHSDMARSVVCFSQEYTAPILKAAYGQMDAFIGTRFHSALFALSQGVPTLAIDYWGPKARGIMQAFDQEEFVLSYERLTQDQLILAFDCLWTRKESISRHLLGIMPGLLTETEKAIERLTSVAGGGM